MRYSQHRVRPRTNQRNKMLARWEMDGGRLLLPLSVVVLVQTRGWLPCVQTLTNKQIWGVDHTGVWFKQKKRLQAWNPTSGSICSAGLTDNRHSSAFHQCHKYIASPEHLPPETLYGKHLNLKSYLDRFQIFSSGTHGHLTWRGFQVEDSGVKKKNSCVFKTKIAGLNEGFKPTFTRQCAFHFIITGCRGSSGSHCMRQFRDMSGWKRI